MRNRAPGDKVKLPFQEWPVADCLAWEALFTDGDPLDEARAGRHWQLRRGGRTAGTTPAGWVG
jgi:hypothetical protein